MLTPSPPSAGVFCAQARLCGRGQKYVRSQRRERRVNFHNGQVTARADVYAAIDAERLRQQHKWEQPHDWGKGDCSSQEVHPLVKLAVLQEEAGEVARALLDHQAANLKTELVQVAAVAVAWLESL